MTLLHGIALTVLAGLSVGFGGWSMKLARIWKWENFWLVYSLFRLVVAFIVIGCANYLVK